MKKPANSLVGPWLHGLKRFFCNMPAVAMAVWLVVFYNQALWSEVTRQAGGFAHHAGLILSLFALVTLYLVLLLSLFRLPWVFKPVVVVLLLGASVASYFMTAYGVVLDQGMIQNVLETDTAEAFELLNFRLFLYFVLLGVLPALAVIRLKIEYKPFFRQLLANFAVSGLALLLMGLLVFANYGEYSTFFRANKYLRDLINPTNFVYALVSHFGQSWRGDDGVVEPIGEDARLVTDWRQRGKKNLIVLVLGETARAANFSLNGYEKDTNPALGRENVVFFRNFYSCGTATATSVPCMFSRYDRASYRDAKAKHTETVLDVLAHAGVHVLWRDNNSGCKGVCGRVEFEPLADRQVDGLCNDKECYDEILLYRLQGYLNRLDGDAVIVLHQKGSHGPAYYRRYPESAEAFKPVCRINQLDDCTREEVVNAYDNTIRYTDKVLGELIELLKANQSTFNTAMIYVSDHGESLGENDIYLHGLPYFIAPDEQKHVPFIVWLSDGLQKETGIDRECLKRVSGKSYSHDNLFHSLLGLAGVETAEYERSADLFAQCRPSRSLAVSSKSQ